MTYFICGDLTAKHRHWNCSRANLAGNLLYDIYLDSNFVVAFPSSLTYIPEDNNRLSLTIDLVITNSYLQYSDLITEYLGSDHNAVTLDITLSSPSILNNERSYRAYNKANWDQYRFIVLRKLTQLTVREEEIHTTHHVDTLIEEFSNIIHHSSSRKCSSSLSTARQV